MSPFLRLRPFERVTLITDLGDVRDDQWTFDVRDRVTRAQGLAVAEAVDNLFPLLLWPEQPLSAEVVGIFNGVGASLGALAENSVLDRVQMHSAHDGDGGRSIVVTFSNANYRPAAAGGRDELTPSMALSGFVRADPEIGFPVDLRAVGRGAHMVEGVRLEFELRIGSRVVPQARPSG